MHGSRPYSIYLFQGFSGILVPGRGQADWPLTVRHSARVDPWKDEDIHRHSRSDEFYLLLEGELGLWVAGRTLGLNRGELLCVRAGFPHAVIGGKGGIEHFGFRAPHCTDRESLGPAGSEAPSASGEVGEPDAEWGYRVSLADPDNRNCWLLGLGAARRRSEHFLFAYLDFPTPEAANEGIGTRLRLHLHRRSWEYYLCLRGSKTLLVEDEELVIQPGVMVEVFPGARHNVIRREAPYVGFTFRAPILDDKEEA